MKLHDREKSHADCAIMSRHDKIEFGFIRFVHETLYGLFVNAYNRLNAAGLRVGQKVLEVGCGPGFFTIPAAKIVGDEGFVYALDLNTFAVEHVRRKIERAGLKNVEVVSADAVKTGLPESSIDVAFLFSVIHAFPDVGAVVKEMHRVLKQQGIMSIQTGWPEERLLDAVTANDLFRLRETNNRLYRFERV
jgi:ubiquinone/menaquinone biosynthesis C-methylase UbiE